MDDGFEIAAGGRVGEGESAHGPAVEAAVRVEHAGAEPRGNGGNCRRTGLDGLAREGVGDLRPFDPRAVARAIAGLPPE